MDKKIKEIAVIIAGIDEEYQNEVMEGIIACAKEYNANISCFAAFGGVISNSRYDEGEYKIYDLINYHRFDGVILLNNTISDESEKEKLIKRVTSSGLPAAALDWNGSPHFFNVRIDNKKAMAEIVNHVIEVHGAKTINYISGPLSNPEAEDRYETFLEVMAQHSLPLDARRVFFGDFRAADGRNAVKAFCRMGLSDPDAIICANDAMALAAAEELESAGYRIPKDIIVTGFDNIYNARHHRPALTTVKRPINEAGYTACKLILEELTGNPQEREVILNASPVFTGSCGCTAEADLTADEYMRSTYSLINRWKSDVSLLNRMTTSLAETETVDEELATIGKFVREIDCEQFCICLCEDWDRAYSSDNHDTDGTYTENMIAPLIISGEHTSSVDSFPCSNMYPVPMVTGGNISYFLPLHYRENCLGYYIITNSDFPLKSMLCHSIMLNISNSMENIRKLISLNSMIHELDRLYVNDQLCNIYNRNGFVRAADALFRKCLDEGSKLLISFIDMDGLKLINDNYGHKEGDFALQHLAQVISDCCTDDKICARFGGDEFIIVGSGSTDDDGVLLESNFHKQLENINRAIGKPYQIEASIGTIVTEVGENVTLFSLITKADSVMYEKKKRKKTSRYLRRV